MQYICGELNSWEVLLVLFSSFPYENSWGLGVILAQGEIPGPQTASSLFFFRFSEESTGACERRAARHGNAYMVICVSSAFCSTDQEKERLLVVYFVLGP